MKTLLTLTFLAAAVVAVAQSRNEPARNEFAIELSSYSLAIKPGETKQITLTVIRHRTLTKGKATFGFSNILPSGITLQYQPVEGSPETSMAIITAAPTATVGTYQLILNGTIQYKTKGSILRLSVDRDNIAAR